MHVLEDHEVQASFVNSRRDTDQEHSDVGIKLAATSNNIAVESIDEEQLILMQYFDEGDQFVEILDVGFIRFQGNDYVIPEELLPEVSQIEGREDLLSFVEQMLVNYMMESSPSAIESVIHQLVEKPEAQLFTEASEALGNQGITGLSHPEVLPFFMFTLRLQGIMDHPEPAREETGNFDEDSCQTLEYNYYNNCFGMCGKECWCWWWTCGDCCSHLGCFEHDECCVTDFWSLACLFPWDFSCDGYSPNC